MIYALRYKISKHYYKHISDEYSSSIFWTTLHDIKQVHENIPYKIAITLEIVCFKEDCCVDHVS